MNKVRTINFESVAIVMHLTVTALERNIIQKTC